MCAPIRDRAPTGRMQADKRHRPVCATRHFASRLHCFLRKSEFVLSSFSVRFLKLSLILKKLIEFVATILTSFSNPSLGYGANQPPFGKSVPTGFQRARIDENRVAHASRRILFPPIRVNLHSKYSSFAASKRAKCFVFKYSFSSFPRFLYLSEFVEHPGKNQNSSRQDAKA